MKIYRSIDLGAMELCEKLKDQSTLEIHFEPMSENELLKSDFDLIELAEQQSQDILTKMTMLDWAIQSTQAVDAFAKTASGFKPIHLSAMTFVNFLQSKHIALDVSKSAVLVGTYSFLMTYAIALSKLGYKKIYLVSPTENDYKSQIESAKKYLFDMDLVQISVDEMANISELASLLAIDFDLSDHAELSEMLTYFNFVTENAIFFDLRNYVDDTLSSEAEKASMRVLDSAEFHLYKYRLFQKNFK